MIDPEGELADALRTLWVWLLIGPAVGPVVNLLPELGYALGLGLPMWSGLVLGGLAAGGLVGLGERRYRRLFIGSLLTLLVWVLATRLLGVGDPRLFGSVRLIAARLLLWLAAVSVAVWLVGSWEADLGPSVETRDESSAP